MIDAVAVTLFVLALLAPIPGYIALSMYLGDQLEKIEERRKARCAE